MAIFVVVENETNIVVNSIIWDGAEFLPPRNHLVIQSDTARIGDIYDVETKTFSSPEV